MRCASRDERGFTLVELMVVILIIAVLIAIAIPIPTFMGFRRRADDVAAKGGANVAIKVAKSLTDEDSYAPVTLGALSATEPSLTFVLGSSQSTGPSVVSQEVPDPLQRTFVLAVYSRSRTCFFVRDDITAATTFGVLLDVPVTDCHADNAGAVAFGPAW
ncbi:MAG: prepilin-type N-terminal cleavage/methylation domain-containing protein [Actinomycetota bacterium]